MLMVQPLELRLGVSMQRLKLFVYYIVSVQVFVVLLFCLNMAAAIDAPLSRFAMADNLMCIIEKSSEEKEIGNRISLIGLLTDGPKVLYGSGVTSPMVKVFESSKTLTIQLVASGSGSVDTIVLDKGSGRFARATAGSFAGIYAMAAVGTCR
jgi:hypothetical protein